MWQIIAREMEIPWRAAEAMHWQLDVVNFIFLWVAALTEWPIEARLRELRDPTAHREVADPFRQGAKANPDRSDRINRPSYLSIIQR